VITQEIPRTHEPFPIAYRSTASDDAFVFRCDSGIDPVVRDFTMQNMVWLALNIPLISILHPPGHMELTMTCGNPFMVSTRDGEDTMLFPPPMIR